jgi:hypothetical protein
MNANITNRRKLQNKQSPSPGGSPTGCILPWARAQPGRNWRCKYGHRVSPTRIATASRETTGNNSRKKWDAENTTPHTDSHRHQNSIARRKLETTEIKMREMKMHSNRPIPIRNTTASREQNWKQLETKMRTIKPLSYRPLLPGSQLYRLNKTGKHGRKCMSNKNALLHIASHRDHIRFVWTNWTKLEVWVVC